LSWRRTTCLGVFDFCPCVVIYMTLPWSNLRPFPSKKKGSNTKNQNLGNPAEPHLWLSKGQETSSRLPLVTLNSGWKTLFCKQLLLFSVIQDFPIPECISIGNILKSPLAHSSFICQKRG
jgi:hypothetical protein